MQHTFDIAELRDHFYPNCTQSNVEKNLKTVTCQHKIDAY